MDQKNPQLAAMLASPPKKQRITMDFYYVPGSAPCRAVLMTAKAVGVDLNLKMTDLQKGEHMKPEYLKINPQHTIPTLVDNGFALWESRAICTYLITKYGTDKALYPEEPQARAVVDQRLYFDMGTLYQRFADYYYPQVFAKQPANPDNYKKMEDAMAFLNTFLDEKKWAAGENLTVADISLVATVSSYDAAGFPLSTYPNVMTWYQKCKTDIPGYNLNQEGVDQFRRFFVNLPAAQ